MKRWVAYAFVSMVFAGFTSIAAKLGLSGISADLGLAVRTLFVFLMVAGFAAVTVPLAQFAGLTRGNLFWLAVSAAATTGSWIFYYKALKDGEVSTIAFIDKGSIIVAALLSVLILKEHMTPKTIVGAALIVTGLLVMARK